MKSDSEVQIEAIGLVQQLAREQPALQAWFTRMFLGKFFVEQLPPRTGAAILVAALAPLLWNLEYPMEVIVADKARSDVEREFF